MTRAKMIKNVPVLTLRDVVVYPHMVIPLFVGRDKSILALDEAMESDKQVLLVAQRSAEVDDPGADDIYEIGTLATILQLLKLPDGTLKVLVEGGQRALIKKVNLDERYFTANIAVIPASEDFDERKVDLLSRMLLNLFDKYVKLNKKIPPEVLSSLSSIDEPARLADTVAAHLGLKVSAKQEILEIIELFLQLATALLTECPSGQGEHEFQETFATDFAILRDLSHSVDFVK